MKESRLYLQFFRNFISLFVLLAIIGVILGFYWRSQLPTKYVTERMYEFPYTLENAAAVEKETEQVIAVLRSNQLKKKLNISSSEIIVFKSAPFAVTLQVKDQEAERSFQSMITLAGFMTAKYETNQIGQELFLVDSKPLLKYLLIGFIFGEITALFFSLMISYFKQY